MDIHAQYMALFNIWQHCGNRDSSGVAQRTVLEDFIIPALTQTSYSQDDKNAIVALFIALRDAALAEFNDYCYPVQEYLNEEESASLLARISWGLLRKLRDTSLQFAFDNNRDSCQLLKLFSYAYYDDNGMCQSYGVTSVQREFELFNADAEELDFDAVIDQFFTISETQRGFEFYYAIFTLLHELEMQFDNSPYVYSLSNTEFEQGIKQVAACRTYSEWLAVDLLLSKNS